MSVRTPTTACMVPVSMFLAATSVSVPSTKSSTLQGQPVSVGIAGYACRKPGKLSDPYCDIYILTYGFYLNNLNFIILKTLNNKLWGMTLFQLHPDLVHTLPFIMSTC